MKKLINNIIKVLFLTILILYSYSYIEKHNLVRNLQEWMHDTATEYLTPEDQKLQTGSLFFLKVSASGWLLSKSAGSTAAADKAIETSSATDGISATAASTNASEGNTAATSKGSEAPSTSEGTETSTISGAQPTEKTSESKIPYRAVWLSYIEFMDYLDSVEENTERNFRNFYNRVVDKAKEAGMTTMIVQVRPFGDAVYPSRFFPWSSCISGVQGKNPGYDPLKIMVEITHKKGLSIEAWINPYRILSNTDISILDDSNQALKWMKSKDKTVRGRVITYQGALYYNPARASVRKLIVDGVCELINNYEIDGIHMDDYFYPDFEPEDAVNSFDHDDYRNYQTYTSNSYRIYHSGKENIFDWRRQNINMLVSDIYKAVKAKNPKLTFGISPNGNLEDLRSNYQYYVDIDSWVNEPGYVDYIMPQLYWGYYNWYSPYEALLNQWTDLMVDSNVKLYIGLPLYRMASKDLEGLEGFEFQQSKLFQYMLEDIQKHELIEGITLFSYEYLDPDSKWYSFESTRYEESQKKILREVFHIIKTMDWNAG